MSAVVDFPVKPEARPYLEAFAPRSGEPEWLQGQRRRSLSRFAELGFPSRRSEAWRYLDLRRLESRPMLPASARGEASAETRARLAEIGLAAPAARLVLVDGCFFPALSATGGLPASVWFGSTAVAIAERPELLRANLEAASGQPFAALNGAFFADGFVLDLPSGIKIDGPIEIVHLASVTSGASLHTRSLVALGAGSRVSLLESFTGAGAYWRNDVVEWRLDRGAELERVLLVEEAADAVHLGEVVATLGDRAKLAAFLLLLDGRTVRHEATVRSEGEGTRVDLNGAFVLSGRQEANIVTTLDHAASGGETREMIKGVAAGRAHGAFQGRIIVRPNAQKVDAHQLSRNLIVGPHAVIDTKPELEISADDVKCSHGAAVGDLDDDALFYLRARGIPEREARHILIEAFVREAIALVGSPVLRDHLLSRVARSLANLEE
jgi:Fe-S cluster assembly protein SufD